ncbi:MAG: flavodoxin family protein [Methanomicrobiaceae archaeon]|nr:flavodoxin family protein [Methanomicrobiaceae archaeon]
MSVTSKIIRESLITGDEGKYLLRLRKESGRTSYPGMHLYRLELILNGRIVLDFRTNTFEYTGGMDIDAEKAAINRFSEWERDFTKNPHRFLEYQEKIKNRQEKLYSLTGSEKFDAVIIEGSPRPDGNSSAFALWIKEILNSLGKTVYVIYPDEYIIHPCIGCYQCYNYGRCTFRDDMTDIISLIKNASFVVICSPVYTNTVPGSLKIIFDRFLAYHAFCSLNGCKNHPEGILFAVAGRKGCSNFDSLVPVCDAFMDTAGIIKKGMILCDNTDETGDIRSIKGLKEKAEEMIEKLIKIPDIAKKADNLL